MGTEGGLGVLYQGNEREDSALTIGGSDSGGGAGIQADIKTFSALGVHGCSVITAITAQNTLGVTGILGMPADIVAAQLQAVTSDLCIPWAKTGMLHSPKIVSLVARYIEDGRTSLVLDPVIWAEAGGQLLETDAIRVLKEELLPLASVITPNIFEAQALSGIAIEDLQDAVLAGENLLDIGSRAVIVTGGHLSFIDLLVTRDGVKEISGIRVKGGNHGVGCAYSAALTAYLIMGSDLEDAAISAKGFAARSIQYSRHVGLGVDPVNQSGHLRRMADSYEAVTEVEDATSMLIRTPSFYSLIPEVGCNLGMAIRDAMSTEDVAAVEGRIVRAGRSALRSGRVRMGASGHIARIILTTMKYDRKMRSALNVKLSEEYIQAAKKMGLLVGNFDRAEEPPDARTMSWGTDTVIQRLGAIPDLIWDAGGIGKEPMIRILGPSAGDVAAKALRITEAAFREEDINHG